MKPYYEHGGVTIHHGDCLEIMREMPEASVTAVVTDPPYGLGFMGKFWDRGIPGSPFWSGALRVSKPGSVLLAFGGTRTGHRLTCAIEDAGWEIRDCLMWLYGSGFPKSLDVSKAIDRAAGAKREVVGIRASYRPDANAKRDPKGFQDRSDGLVTAPATEAAQLWQGYGTALKPAWEPIILAMKPLDGTFAQNALEHGVAGLNVDGCRIALGGNDRLLKGGSYSGNRNASNKASAFNAGQGGIKYTNPPGRWPANLLLDEEVTVMLDEQSGESTSTGGLTPGKGTGRTEGKYGSVLSRTAGGLGDSGGASRFFYTAKASKFDRNAEGFAHNDHPTVKPVDLMRWLVRLVAMPKGAVVLDPFMGSGSTIVAAREENVRVIGIDIDEHYCEIAARRLAQEVLDFGGGQ